MGIGRGRGLILLGTLALHLVAPATPARAQTTERGVPFPLTLEPPGGGPAHRLTGTATRERTILGIDVYAYGLYLEPDAARAQLTPFANQPSAALERNAALFTRLLDLHVPMLLRLVTTRELAGDQLRGAFDDALTPRVRRAAPRGMAGGEAALDQFRTFFDLRQVSKGTEIIFSCDTGGRLRTAVQGEQRPDVASRALCWALFDTYLGDNAISRDGRRRLVAGVSSVVSGSK